VSGIFRSMPTAVRSTSFIDLDLKSPEYRIAVSAQKDFSALNPNYVVTNSRRTAERAQAAFHPR
jgi:hypothetical protein